MYKKTILLELDLFSTSAMLVSYSYSHNTIGQAPNSSYNINPSNWLPRNWKNSDDNRLTFTTNDIPFSDINSGSCKFLYISWKKYIYNKSKLYYKSQAEDYYEVENFYYVGYLYSNIKASKI